MCRVGKANGSAQSAARRQAPAGDPARRNTIRGRGRLGLLDTPLSRGMTVGLMMAALSSVPAFAGTWKYEYVSNDGHVVTYVEDGKTIFYIGCGRGFSLHAKYPGTPKMEGDATIRIATSRDRMTFKGEFEEPVDTLVQQRAVPLRGAHPQQARTRGQRLAGRRAAVGPRLGPAAGPGRRADG